MVEKGSDTVTSSVFHSGLVPRGRELLCEPLGLGVLTREMKGARVAFRVVTRVIRLFLAFLRL